MRRSRGVSVALVLLIGVGGCTVRDKGSTPADTATGHPTRVAPAKASAPVVPGPADSGPTVQPAPAPAKAVSRTAPRTTTTRPRATSATPVEPMRDSAFKPRATVDDKGNITPIKRDTLK